MAQMEMEIEIEIENMGFCTQRAPRYRHQHRHRASDSERHWTRTLELGLDRCYLLLGFGFSVFGFPISDFGLGERGGLCPPTGVS